MRLNLFARGVVAAYVAGCLAPVARAAVVLEFVTPATSYSLQPSATTTIPIFLRETLTDGSTSILVAENSLFSALARVIRSGVEPSNPATVTAALGDVGFNGFDDSEIQNSGALALIGGSRRFSTPPGPPIITDSTTVRRVAIGTIDIQAGSVGGQTTTFTLGDRPSFGDTLTLKQPTPTELDAQIVNTTFAVTVLPEPATAGVVALVAGGLLVGRRRRNA